MLCKQHLSKQEDKAQTWPRNPSTDPGHTDWLWSLILSLFFAVPQQHPKLHSMGFILPLQAEHTLGKAKSRTCSQARDFRIWSMICSLSWMKLGNTPKEELPILLGKSTPALHYSSQQQHCCSQTHACSTVCLCPNAVRSWTCSADWNPFIIKAYPTISVLVPLQSKSNGVHSDTGCTELLSWCVPQQHLTQVGIAESWTKTRETPGLQGVL